MPGGHTERVQIVEANDYGVCVVELRLESRDSSLKFLLYPMLHVGGPDFYTEVTHRLAAVDVVVAEGVGSSRAGRGLTMSYREMARDARLGLMVQHINFAALKGRVICPDCSGEEFEARWRTIPRSQRAAARAGITSVTAAQRVFGSRWLQLSSNPRPRATCPTRTRCPVGRAPGR